MPPECIDVGQRANGFGVARGLLGGHVNGRAQHLSGVGLPLIAKLLGQAEVVILGIADCRVPIAIPFHDTISSNTRRFSAIHFDANGAALVHLQ